LTLVNLPALPKSENNTKLIAIMMKMTVYSIRLFFREMKM